MARRWMSILLYPVFALWLVIPWIRRQRRRPRWWLVRLVMLGSGAAFLLGIPVLRPAGALLVALATVLPPLRDPDHVRKTAEALGAPHIVNGGFFRAGALEAPPGAPLLFLLSAGEMLVVPGDQPENVLARHTLDSLTRIRLDGSDYQPHYVSFAKEPPRREPQPVPETVARLHLDLGSTSLETEYRGVFARHLAEVAARTLHDHAPRPPALAVIA